ncbi:MAG: hypothetical protein ACNI27_04830 [Desulfovibrio sp.]
MAFDLNSIVMQSALTGAEKSPAPGSMAAKAQSMAFQSQMSMAQALFKEPGSDNDGMDSFSGDMGVVENAMMLDALTTIRRLTGDGKGAGAQGGNPYAAGLRQQSSNLLGELSALFESGSKGSDAIGWDRTGGTSYGRFQISSKQGSMDQFISFMEKHQPEWANALKGAGDADTGSKSGAMVDVWKSLVRQDPKALAKLEQDFITSSHYEPARKKIAELTGIDLGSDIGGEKTKALKEVLWSTAVQHGATGAADLFSKALGKVDQNSDSYASNIIKEVYSMRKDRFSSSTERVRESVQNRLGQEEKLALAMIGGGIEELA